MIFWQTRNKERITPNKMLWAGYRGVFSIRWLSSHRHGAYGEIYTPEPGDHVWFRMLLQFQTVRTIRHFWILYDGSVYFRCVCFGDAGTFIESPRNDNAAHDLGLSMMHKRCLDLVIRNQMRKDAEIRKNNNNNVVL